MLKRRTKFIVCGVAFMLGIISADFFDYSINWLLLLLFIPVMIITWSRKKALFVVLVALCLMGGYVRFINSMPDIESAHIRYFNNASGQEWNEMKTVVWQGKISNEIDKRVDHTKLILQSEAVFVNDAWQGVSGLVLVKASLFPEYQYGDSLEIECKMVATAKINDFAYDDYLSRYEIYSLCYSPRIILIDHLDGFNIRAFIFDIKDKIHHKIQSNILEPESSILSAMLLARRRGIPADIIDNFSRAGVSHLLAISGMHIAIISLLIARFLSVFYLPKKISYPGTLLILFVYIVMIGFPASAVRAGIMGSIVLIAEYFGRINKSYFALLLVAVVTLIINPKLIVFDIGWQLSFLAVLSLILFSDDIAGLTKKWPKFSGATAILQTTFAAQVLTLPWLAYKFGQISLVFPIANVLLLPTLPFIMSMSIIALISSFLSQSLSAPLFWILWNILNKQVEIVQWLGSLSLSAMQIPRISLLWIVFIYIVIFLLKIKPRRIISTRQSDKERI
jgi:competence protein ComEC